MARLRPPVRPAAASRTFTNSSSRWRSRLRPERGPRVGITQEPASSRRMSVSAARPVSIVRIGVRALRVCPARAFPSAASACTTITLTLWAIDVVQFTGDPRPLRRRCRGSPLFPIARLGSPAPAALAYRRRAARRSRPEASSPAQPRVHRRSVSDRAPSRSGRRPPARQDQPVRGRVPQVRATE